MPRTTAERIDTRILAEQARSVDVIEGLVEAHVGRVRPALRRMIEDNPAGARLAVIEAFGYVPADPAAFVRLKAGECRYDGHHGCTALPMPCAS